MMLLRAPLALTVLVTLVTSVFGSSLAAAQVGGRSFLRQIYGDLAVEVRSAPANALRIGAANGERSLTVTVLARDLRRWADSATRILAARAVVRRDTTRFQAMVEGPGVSAGSMTLSRTLSANDTVITLFVADAEFQSVRTVVSAEEARALVGAMRRAANAVLPPPARGRGGGVRSGRSGPQLAP
ncbi:MAG TPA: hypothetical protein VLE53_12265 [Gemmatimonadaceae bacterium]|nr:hypothetical protein [Gemmatimonadaceae bacterium]